MQFTVKAQFLKSYVQHYKNPDTGVETDYYKVTVYSEEGFDKSPNLPVDEECFKRLKLDNHESELTYRTAPTCSFVCDLSFFNGKPNINIVDIIKDNVSQKASTNAKII